MVYGLKAREQNTSIRIDWIHQTTTTKQANLTGTTRIRTTNQVQISSSTRIPATTLSRSTNRIPDTAQPKQIYTENSCGGWIQSTHLTDKTNSLPNRSQEQQKGGGIPNPTNKINSGGNGDGSVRGREMPQISPAGTERRQRKRGSTR